MCELNTTFFFLLLIASIIFTKARLKIKLELLKSKRANSLFCLKFNTNAKIGSKLLMMGSLRKQGMVWNGMENGMEWNGNSVWNMEDARMECNGRFQEWNGRQSSILPYQFRTRFCALLLQKNKYLCWVVISNIVTKVFNFNIYANYLSTNRGALVVHIAQTV